MAVETTTATHSFDGMAIGELYRDLHRHPELAFHEERTAGIVARSLTAFGYETTTRIGRTGVVGVMSRGDGPTVLLRADMDGLPVEEQTGLEYASTAQSVDSDGTAVPVMHACGHDMHVTCLLGAAARLADDTSWSGTLMVVFQPGEEFGQGARAMLDDDLYGRFGRPDIVLGQHVAPLPAGTVGLHPGPALAACDDLKATLHGTGGHGSRPDACVDPILMAASVVTRLQGIVSREIAGSEAAVVTVGSFHAGSAPNIIPDTATLDISVRTFDARLRDRVLASVRRIITAEAQASGAPRAPEIEVTGSYPLLHNDPEASARTSSALATALGAGRIFDPGAHTASEDVGLFASDAGIPCVYWVLGGADPSDFDGAADFEAVARVAGSLPSNHSPLYAPVPEPTITVGVTAQAPPRRNYRP